MIHVNIAIGENGHFFDQQLDQVVSFFKREVLQTIGQQLMKLVDTLDDLVPSQTLLLLEMEVLALFVEGNLLVDDLLFALGKLG